MKKEIIAVGDKVDLIKVGKFDKKETSEQYKSKILDIIDDKNIKISMPMKNGRVIPLEVGTRYRLWIYTKSSLYSCEGIIEERYRFENLFVLEVHIETKLEKLQRREYYRFSCVIDLRYRLSTDEEQKYIEMLDMNEFETKEEKEECQNKLNSIKVNWLDGCITDLSGGGARINIDDEYDKGTLLHLKFPLLLNYENEYLECAARIIESFRVENKQRKYEVRVEFLDVKKEFRDTIVKFIFDEERKIIRKEKGMS